MAYCRQAIEQMSGYVPGEQPRDRRYIKLNTNENPYPPSPAVARALDGLATAHLRLYPDPAALELRQVAGDRYGLSCDWVMCGNGSDDLLTIAVRTYVNEGESLACFDPSYSLYPVLAEIQGAETVRIPLGEHFDVPANTLGMARGCKLLFVARPNAPTGNAFPMDTMRRLCEGFEGIVWVDEAYADFADDHCVDFVREFPNVIVSRTLSKSYSLAAIRLGFLYAHPERIEEMLKVKDSYNVGMITQAVALAALRDTDYMELSTGRIRGSRAHVSRELSRRAFTVLPSSANFIFAKPPIPAADYMRALRDRGVLVRYFSGPRTAEFVRITIGTDEEMAALVTATDDILLARQ